MNFNAVSLEIGVLSLGAVVIVMDLLLSRATSHRALSNLTICGLAVLFLGGFLCYHGGASPTFLAGLYVADNYAIFFKQLFLLATMFTVLFAKDYAQNILKAPGEFYALLLFALLGMCVLASANDFLTAFLGLELMTISFYALVGLRFDSILSSEAAVKYLVVGAGSTAVLLFGLSLIYGATGGIVFTDVCLSPLLLTPLGLAGLTMVLVGFFFKLSAIPFHMWAPDVYEGAPTPVTALLAMGSKAAGLAVLMRVLFVAFSLVADYWLPIIAVLSFLGIVGGNLMALRQADAKRMLAYSSIAQAGYMLVGIVAADPAGMKAVMFYALLYVFANVGAFAVLSVVDEQAGGTTLTHLRGLARTAPVLAAAMTVSLLSMAGIPPTAGFAGKIYLFTAAVDKGYIGLAFAGFIMSMVSVYYYLMVAKAMYLAEEPAVPSIAVTGSVRAAVTVSVALTIALGVCPEPLAALTNMAALTFLQ